MHACVYKVASFSRAALSYSTVQPPFDINFPWSLGYIRNYHSGLPGETISLPGLCVANILRLGISNLNRHRPPRVPIHTLVEWTRDLSIFSRTRYHWNNSLRWYIIMYLCMHVSVNHDRWQKVLIKCIQECRD